MRVRQTLRFTFARKKEIVVNSLFSQKELGKYTSLGDKEVEALAEQTRESKHKWLQVPLPQRQQILSEFQAQLQTESYCRKVSHLLSQCTGKELKECESEARVASKILKKQLTELYNKPSRLYCSNGELRDYYELEPFDHLLAVFDHRHPILSAVKYLGLALYSGNHLFLRPSPIVLPVISTFQQTWSSLSDLSTFTILADPQADPKQEDSPVPKLLSCTDGFISFDGRVKDGFNFHYFMTVQSPSLRESEFLLTSSDSAYIMGNLSGQQLGKAARVVARGCFSNYGHNFNSIKRVYVDRKVGENFLQLLVQEASKYAVQSKEAYEQVNNGLLAPFTLKHELEEAVKQLANLKEKHSEEIRHVMGGDFVSLGEGDKTLKFITPAIFQVTTDYPNYNYQNEEFMLPICFLSFVDSPSDCIQRINSSIFGTTASIFTADNSLPAIQLIGKRLDVGTVNVNTWEVTDGITYSGRKRSGKGFSFSPLSYHNILRTRAVSYSS